MTVQTQTLRLYTPHDAQLAFHNGQTRYRVASWGRQGGKSTACLNDLAFKAWVNPGHTYWFVSPTFEQARVQYRRFVGMLMACPAVMAKKNQTELRIKFVNHSQIVFKSGEVLDNLRGETLNGVAVDEVRDQHPDLWKLVLRPMLTTTNGWAVFVSTPRGYDQFYDLFERAKVDPDWQSFYAPSTCNPLFTQEELELARKEMGPDEFAQEIMAEFRELGKGKVYLNHGPDNQLIDNPFAIRGQDWTPYLPIVVALDFNVSPMSWAIGQVRGSNIHFGDEISIQNTNTQQATQVLVQKLIGHKAGVNLIGDASGKARKTSSNETDYQIILAALRDAGIVNVRNLTPDANPSISDRVNVVNAMLKSAAGQVRLTYNPVRCPNLKRDLERVSWKVGTQNLAFNTSDPNLTHMSDAIGYVCYHYGNEWKPKAGRMRVLSR